MFAAYETLPADLKQAATGKIAVHDASTNSAGMPSQGLPQVTDVRRRGGAPHIRWFAPNRRPDRKALFRAGPNGYVLAHGSGERGVARALWAHATQPQFAMCHEWKVGDLLMWNISRSCIGAIPFDPKARRIMHRSQIKGNERASLEVTPVPTVHSAAADHFLSFAAPGARGRTPTFACLQVASVPASCVDHDRAGAHPAWRRGFCAPNATSGRVGENTRWRIMMRPRLGVERIAPIAQTESCFTSASAQLSLVGTHMAIAAASPCAQSGVEHTPRSRNVEPST